MELTHVALLLVAGLAGGLLAGLAGLGGGIVFVPVLLYHFRSLGIEGTTLAQLTIGTSLFCTMLASLSSARAQLRKGAVNSGFAIRVGLASAVSIACTTKFVTSAPWFDDRVFQVVFSGILLVVAAKMLLANGDEPEAPHRERGGAIRLFGVGLLAGAVSSSAGVGGGVVLVPLYRHYLRLPMHTAVGTSSASIVLITLIGTMLYAMSGFGAAGLTGTAIGYVDVVRAILLAAPAVWAARRGVTLAHRMRSTTMQTAFGVLILLVATQLIWTAFRP